MADESRSPSARVRLGARHLMRDASLSRLALAIESGPHADTGTFVEPDALELVALAEQIELGLRAIRRDEGEDPISGVVRVSVAEGVIATVTQRLCELRRAHPSLRLEILSENRLVDLARREADVALRSTKTASYAVIQRSLGRAQFGL